MWDTYVPESRCDREYVGGCDCPNCRGNPEFCSWEAATELSPDKQLQFLFRKVKNLEENNDTEE
jgi:hypothetical protein